MQRELARASVFSERVRLASSCQTQNLAVLSVIGIGNNTVETAFKDTYQKPGEFVFDTDHPRKFNLTPEVLSSEGDGSVTVQSATLPLCLQPHAVVLTSKAQHAELISDREVLKQAISFLAAP